jgi:hypothetical protein
MDGLTSRMERTKEGVKEMEDRIIQITQFGAGCSSSRL